MLLFALGVMTVIAIAIVAIPIIRPGNDSEQEAQHDANYRAYRQRLQEINAELADGQIDADESEAAKNELATRLLAETQQENARSIPNGRVRRWWVVAMVIFIPWAAGAFYWQQGSGERYLDRQRTAQQPQQGPSNTQRIARLKAHLAHEPDDINSWGMLGDSYNAEQNYSAAANAFKHANELSGGRDPELLVAQGVMQALAAHGDFHGSTAQLFRAALKLDPRMPQALLYAGLAAYQTGQYREAIRHFQVLYRQPLSPQMKATVRLHLNAARAQIGLPPIGAVKTQSSSDSNKLLQIPVRISLAPKLAKLLPGSDTVYVFARAISGPNMPLAVVRLSVKDLPQTVDLSDSVSMLQGLKLSAYKSWLITARLSANGDAGPAQPGDYETSKRLDESQLPTLVRLTIRRRFSNVRPLAKP